MNTGYFFAYTVNNPVMGRVSMFLEVILREIPVTLRHGSPAVDIKDITDDSRKVREDSLFICIRGMETDGHAYIHEALKKGAAALLVENDYYESHKNELKNCGSVTVVSVQDTRQAAAAAAAAYYGYPSEELKVIGITGTKGKTTTSYMVRAILEKAGYKTGLLGTIDYGLGDLRLASERTTPEAIDIQKYLRHMADNGCQFAVMEVSSQGLKLHRADHIRFDVGVFTNLGSDHISAREHADMNEYAGCKAMLFQKCRIGIGNKDDAWYDRIFEQATCKRETFSCETQADFRAEDITLVNRDGWLGTLFSVGSKEYSVAVPGLFSVYNALAAIAVCSHYGISPDVMRSALSETMVKGRVEIIKTDRPYMVLIDYAHNAMSLKNILTTMRRYHPYRLMVLFGCGGGRARGRRREMGRVAGKYADFTVITSDNPRYEEPEAIMQEIQAGMAETTGEYIMIPDRKAAIRYLLGQGQRGDILILAGKGHELYQEVAGQKIDFDERKIVREILNEYEG